MTVQGWAPPTPSPSCCCLQYSCCLDLQSESIFGWNLSVNCVNFLDLENAVCIGLRLISLTWLPREGNLNLTSQQMCIGFVTSHASFLYKYLNSLSICTPPCWNERQDKRHRDDVVLWPLLLWRAKNWTTTINAVNMSNWIAVILFTQLLRALAFRWYIEFNIPLCRYVINF